MKVESRLVARIARAAALFSFSLVAGSGLFGARTEATELKLAHWMSPLHSMHAQLMVPWAKEVAEMSGGSLTIRIFPGGALGQGPAAQFQRAADGVVDVAFGLPGFTSSQFRRTDVIELPAVAQDAADGTNKLWNVFDGYLAPEWSRVKVIALFIGEPSIIITRDKPVRSVADFRGLKIRTPSKNQAEVIEALGATPVTMTVDQIYNAMSTGVIDGALIGGGAIKSFKLGEVIKYVTTGLPFARSPFFLVMNKKAYEALSPEHKAIIDKTTGRALSIKAANIHEREGAEVVENARKSGKEVIAFAPDEAKKALLILEKTRTKLANELEKDGVPADKILVAMGIKG